MAKRAVEIAIEEDEEAAMGYGILKKKSNNQHSDQQNTTLENQIIIVSNRATSRTFRVSESTRTFILELSESRKVQKLLLKSFPSLGKCKNFYFSAFRASESAKTFIEELSEHRKVQKLFLKCFPSNGKYKMFTR
ncbi:MAG: hypothetical protein PHI32_09720 [Dysgonamonadaceae bacterium]|nr:hypothetical protein [Dysgonamonadaceae bacterium]